jgi:Zn-dependent M28 family amino/carboxypeptidase
MRYFLAAIACCTLLAQPALHLSQGPEVQAALDRVSADSLRGHLSFIASDALEGRDTPSRGLDIAAEYIAAQFRRAGLEAPVNGGYFETADFLLVTRVTEGLSLTLDRTGGESIRLGPPDITVARGNSAIDLAGVPLFKLAAGSSIPDEVAGKAVLAPSRSGAGLMRGLRAKKPAVILTTGRRSEGAPAHALVPADQADAPAIPILAVRGDAAEKAFDALPAGLTPVTVTIHAPAPRREAVKLRNVIGVVRGSDPQLKNTYVMVTAHYDHLGMKPDGEGDRIYNGANDDGSGTVSVIELAAAIATMNPHPRRSIVFMTLFGEEEGLLGSQYYARHPVFPLRQTVADINLEQIGRTDDNEGPQVKAATFTGFTYSDLPALFAEAGKATGVKVYDRNTGNDPFFARSDNQALADAGIPAHTVAVGLEFPDYHQVGDEWNKIDYTNMTIIDRMLGLGIISIANDPEPPKWNQANPNATKYVNAWKTLQQAPAN